jgi:hypothetical protein
MRHLHVPAWTLSLVLIIALTHCGGMGKLSSSISPQAGAAAATSSMPSTATSVPRRVASRPRSKRRVTHRYGRPTESRPEPRALDQAEIARLLEAARNPSGRAAKRGTLGSEPWFYPAVAFSV